MSHFNNKEKLDEIIRLLESRVLDKFQPTLDQIRQFYQSSFPEELPSRFKGTRDPLIKRRFLVGLSGGIDSAVVTYLAVSAVGHEFVLPVAMPMFADDPGLELARLIRKDLGLYEVEAPYEIPLFDTLASYSYASKHLIDPDGGSAREKEYRMGNFASRMRTAVLYDLQRAIRGRVLGTQNRTEYCLGYGAKYGMPSAYDFGVLDHFYKVEIYALAKMLYLPKAVINQAPSSGFWPGQTHAEELGASIEEQDAVCYLLFEKGLRTNAEFEEYGLDPYFAQAMLNRWNESRHKREICLIQPCVDV